MAIDITRQLCLLHRDREAVARCIRCSDFFCRECVLEHDGRMTCARCLEQDVAALETRADSRFALFLGIVPLFQFALGLLFLWVTYYLLARLLLAVPSAFHEGNLWEKLDF